MGIVMADRMLNTPETEIARRIAALQQVDDVAGEFGVVEVFRGLGGHLIVQRFFLLFM